MMRAAEVAAIAAVLVAHGHDRVLAERWARAGRRAGLVELYCRVGVWHPDAAEAAENVGLGVGELAHRQVRSWGDTVGQLDEAIGWYDSDEAAGDGYDPVDLAAARACLEAVRARHAREADAGPRRVVPLPWEVEDNWLPRYRQPRVRVTVTLIETVEGVVEVWPGGEDHDSAAPEAFFDDAADLGCPRPAPGRFHRGVRLDDHDAVSVLEDFLEEQVDTGGGIVHWERTSVYVAHADGQIPALVGLVFDLDPGDANWRYTPSLFET
jgi:hypothetical protein